MAVEFTWVPDRDLSSDVKLDIAIISYGDGYEMRMAKSLNPIKQTWNLNFKNRPVSLISDIRDFLVRKEGIIAFTFEDHSCPPIPITSKVVCASWTISVPIQGFQSLSCVFRRVPL